MISIKHKLTEKLKQWYYPKLQSIILEKVNNLPAVPESPIAEEVLRGLRAMDDGFLWILLTGSRQKLEERYTWVGYYTEFCDLIADILALKTKDGKYCIDEINQKLNSNSNIYLQEAEKIFCSSYRKKLSHPLQLENQSQCKLFIKDAEEILEKINTEIRKCIDYSYMTADVRHRLIRDLDISVCPYCNRMFTQNVVYYDEKGEEQNQAIADLDHFYPKSVYQLFSLSLWNFVPSCKPCNQIFKKDKTLRILPPTEAGFDEECTYTLDLKPDNSGNYDSAALLGFGKITGKWKVKKDAPHKEMIENSIRMFRLDDQYSLHDKEIKDILRKQYVEETFMKCLDDFLGKIDEENPISPLTESDRNRLLYGVSLQPENFVSEPLSKMTYDILKKGR